MRGMCRKSTSLLLLCCLNSIKKEILCEKLLNICEKNGYFDVKNLRNLINCGNLQTKLL